MRFELRDDLLGADQLPSSAAATGRAHRAQLSPAPAARRRGSLRSAKRISSAIFALELLLGCCHGWMHRRRPTARSWFRCTSAPWVSPWRPRSVACRTVPGGWGRGGSSSPSRSLICAELSRGGLVCRGSAASCLLAAHAHRSPAARPRALSLVPHPAGHLHRLPARFSSAGGWLQPRSADAVRALAEQAARCDGEPAASLPPCWAIQSSTAAPQPASCAVCCGRYAGAGGTLQRRGMGQSSPYPACRTRPALRRSDRTAQAPGRPACRPPACNSLIFREGIGWHGENTDPAGLQALLALSPTRQRSRSGAVAGPCPAWRASYRRSAPSLCAPVKERPLNDDRTDESDRPLGVSDPAACVFSDGADLGGRSAAGRHAGPASRIVAPQQVFDPTIASAQAVALTRCRSMQSTSRAWRCFRSRPRLRPAFSKRATRPHRQETIP